YIRALARDLGEAVGSRAHLGALRRTRVGALSVEAAHTLEELQDAENVGALRACFLDPVADFGLPAQGVAQPSVRPSAQVASRPSAQGVAQPPAQLAARPSVQPAAVIPLTTDSALGEFVCAIGVFDGLHEGHRFVIGEAVAQARRAGLSAVAITFDKDPDELFLKPADQRKLLINEDRVGLLATSGVDVVLVIPFNEVLASQEPVEFLNTVIAAHGTPRGIHVGADFRFGHRATGTVDDLRLWGAQRDCTVSAHKLFSDEGLPVTSTRIRNALQAGEIALANQLLTRSYFLWARVTGGRNMGKELGFPTANLELEERLVRPADGVYAGIVEAEGQRYRSAISVGVPATFDNVPSTIEAHLLDFEGDLYDRRIKVSFVEYLRPMQAFPTVDELKRVVQSNIEQARALSL
ncbi:MAG: riboflavin biosynthesis protein RibF, partial [Coriobacteriales bacterium]|nr:riboflavin biosynthesis protein RibF [Coriobacteriales bacterium]